MIDAARLPHFQGALRLSARRGTCFHRAAGFVLDVPRAHLELGTFRAATDEERAWYREHRPQDLDSLSPVPFIHAWAVIGDTVIAPTLYERIGLRPMPRADYLRINDARDVHRVLRADLKGLDRAHGLGAHLKRGLPLSSGLTLGEALLDAAGIAWAENGLGGVVPA